MFLIRSHHPTPPGLTLNAFFSIPDRTARRAKRLDKCEELGEMGMDIARASHREALRDMQPPPEHRAPIPGLTYSHEPAPKPRDTAFGHLFAVISRCVRQTLLLEDRLDAAVTDHSVPNPEPRASQPPPATPASADGPRLCAERLYQERSEDERLHEDPRPVEDILAHIRSELGAAASAGLAPLHQTPAPKPQPRRPIPIIPPGPKPSLTALERAALLHHQTHPPKPPD